MPFIPKRGPTTMPQTIGQPTSVDDLRAFKDQMDQMPERGPAHDDHQQHAPMEFYRKSWWPPKPSSDFKGLGPEAIQGLDDKEKSRYLKDQFLRGSEMLKQSLSDWTEKKKQQADYKDQIREAEQRLGYDWITDEERVKYEDTLDLFGSGRARVKMNEIQYRAFQALRELGPGATIADQVRIYRQAMEEQKAYMKEFQRINDDMFPNKNQKKPEFQPPQRPMPLPPQLETPPEGGAISQAPPVNIWKG